MCEEEGGGGATGLGSKGQELEGSFNLAQGKKRCWVCRLPTTFYPLLFSDYNVLALDVRTIPQPLLGRGGHRLCRHVSETHPATGGV